MAEATPDSEPACRGEPHYRRHLPRMKRAPRKGDRVIRPTGRSASFVANAVHELRTRAGRRTLTEVALAAGGLTVQADFPRPAGWATPAAGARFWVRLSRG